MNPTGNRIKVRAEVRAWYSRSNILGLSMQAKQINRSVKQDCK